VIQFLFVLSSALWVHVMTHKQNNNNEKHFVRSNSQQLINIYKAFKILATVGRALWKENMFLKIRKMWC